MQPKIELLNAQVINIYPLESGVSGGGKDWSRQAFVVRTDAEYPKEIKVDVFSEKAIAAFDKADLSIGSFVDLGVNIESKEWNGKWYTSIFAYFIKKVGEGEIYRDEPEPIDDGQDPGDSLPF